MDTVMLNLQAAVVTTAVTSAGTELTDIPDDGLSFSDVLAQTTGGMGQAENTVQTEASETSENGVIAEDTAVQTDNAAADVDTETEDVPNTEFKFAVDDIAKLIENSESGVKKALRMLLKAVVKAICGSNDGRERKTDLFSVLGGNSTGFFDDSGSDMDTLFMGAEIMDRIGLALEFGLNSEDTETDDVISGLDKLVKKIFADVEDDEEIDENAAAEIVAALLHIPMNDEITFAPEEEKVEAVENAVTALKAPKEEVKEVQPEKIPEAERLVDEFKAEIEAVKYQPKTETETSVQDTVNNARSVMQMNNFAAARINDAGAQIRAISGEDVTEEVTAVIAEDTDTETAETEAAELAAAINAEPQAVRLENTSEIKIETEESLTARSVEEQLTEAVTEKSFEIKEDNGTEELIMVLKPENLGQVAIKLVKENGAVSVMLSAQYDEVGKMMTERAASLGNSLSDNHVEVKSVEVVNPSNAAEQMGLAFTNQGFSFAQNFSRGQDYSPERRGGYDGIDEIEGADVIDATNNIELIREARLWTTA